MDKKALSIAIKNLAEEKGLRTEEVIQAVENSIEVVARKEYPGKRLEVKLDPETMEHKIFHVKEYVAEIEDPENEIEGDGDNIGSTIATEMPPVKLGRIGASIAKQIISRDVTSAERNRILEEFEPKIGEFCIGIVQRIERGNVYMNIGHAEAIMPRLDCIRGEKFNKGERVKAIISGVKTSGKSPFVIVSRSDVGFVLALLTDEIPEIRNGDIEINSIAREPGVKTKVIVTGKYPGVNVMGACIGLRGRVIQDIITELHGERVDIIENKGSEEQILRDSVAPAIPREVYINEDEGSAVIVVSEDDIAKAMGKYRSNERLTGELFGWKVSIRTTKEQASFEDDKRKAFVNSVIEGLDVDDVLANELFNNGFRSIESIAYCEKKFLIEVGGEDLAAELQKRARNNMIKVAIDGKSHPISDLDLSIEMATALLDSNINSCEDLADMASDDIDFLGIGSEEAGKIIIKAREIVGMIK